MKESKIFSNHNLAEKVHYVYRVTIDEHYYIGKRSGSLNDLHAGRYKTSSNIIQEKLKNGAHFSKIKILQVFSTEIEALEYEKRILMRVNAKRNPKFLNQHNGNGNYTLKQHSEKSKEKMTKIQRNRWDENTKKGIKNRENMSKVKTEFYKTERGMKDRERRSQLVKEQFDINTESGQQNRENMSKAMKEYFNTEEGRKRCENHSKIMKEKAKEQLQKRINASILGNLMFDEDFIKENFLIKDDKNNPRFLWSVYSKLTGYSKCHIAIEKRIGKLSFLYGIKSISISEEQENAKIKEIEQLLKSKNEKE